MITSIALGIAGIFAVPLLTKAIYSLLTKLAAKANVELTTAQQEQLKQVAQEAAIATEEFAANQIKNAKAGNTGATVMDGQDKEQHALNIITSILPHIDASSAWTALHAALPKLGIGALAKK